MTATKATIKDDTLFTKEELLSLDRSKVPQHIAIIPDGNRRWAKEQLLDVNDGYLKAADTLKTTAKACKELGVEVLTAFLFSTENWSRPIEEIKAIMDIIADYLIKCQNSMIEMDIRLNVIGNLGMVPERLKQVIRNIREATASCASLDVILAINYGSRDELKRAVKMIVKDCLNGKLSTDNLSEESIGSYLDTSCWPDPDLIIRTSGEKRISNFLLWQSSYAEIYVEQTNWPNFTPKHLLNAVLDYQQRERRRGGGVF